MYSNWSLSCCRSYFFFPTPKYNVQGRLFGEQQKFHPRRAHIFEAQWSFFCKWSRTFTEFSEFRETDDQ